MKSSLIFFVCGIVFSSLCAYTVLDYIPRKSTAEADQLQGMYIFVDSKPVKEYEYIGTVKTTFGFGDSQYTGIRDKLIKKAKKDFPQADGLILHFKTGGSDRCDAIKFKD